jgi:hypothetical protein
LLDSHDHGTKEEATNKTLGLSQSKN